MKQNQSNIFDTESEDNKNFLRGFLTNGIQGKTRQSTRTALAALSASVRSRSTAYDAFRQDYDDIVLTLDGFKSDLQESETDVDYIETRASTSSSSSSNMFYNSITSSSNDDSHSSDLDSSGVHSSGSYVITNPSNTNNGKDSDRDSGHLSIPDSGSEYSLNETISAWDISAPSPANSQLNLYYSEDDLSNLKNDGKTFKKDKIRSRKDKIMMSIKTFKKKIMKFSKTNREDGNELDASKPSEESLYKWVVDTLSQVEKENKDNTDQKAFPNTSNIVSIYIECLKKCIEKNLLSASTPDLCTVFENVKESDGEMSPISYVLRKLKYELRSAEETFILEYISKPNRGMILLVHLLQDIQVAGMALSETASQMADQGLTLNEYQQQLEDENNCLLCLKYMLRFKTVVQLFLDIRHGLETVAHSLVNGISKTKLAALQIFTLCLTEANGLQFILDAFSYMCFKFGEPMRFKLLMNMLKNTTSQRFIFQVTCMKFVNSMLNATTTLNHRVFLQHQLLTAGLDIDFLEKQESEGTGSEQTELHHEIINWKTNYINVESIQEEQIMAESRNSILRREVDILQAKMKNVEKDFEASKSHLTEASKKSKDYQERVFELQEKMESLMQLYEEKTGQQDGINLVADVLRPVDLPESSKERRDSSASVTSTVSNTIPAPPPAPPIRNTNSNYSSKRKFEPKVNLPVLNWLPLSNVHKTIFEELDDTIIYEEIDFSDFESKFQISNEKNKDAFSRNFKSVRKFKNRLKVLENNRARNLVITLRKIGHSAHQIREYIDKYDTNNLHGEYAELLLKYVPTKEEAKFLSKYSKDYFNLDMSEQLMYQLSHIDRVENKLKVMTFMGQYPDIVDNVKPLINRVSDCSKSLTDNTKLKKIFEIILAFGNYMNSSKRGCIDGFKLESLMKLCQIKSKNCNQSLLEYLVHIICCYYPALMTWYDEIDLQIQKSASYQSIAVDIFTLRKGIDLVKFEREKSSSINESLEAFYNMATTEMHTVWESFRLMEESYKDICSKFGENYKSIDPGLFFSYFKDFSVQFKEALEKSLGSNQLTADSKSLSMSAIYQQTESDSTSSELDAFNPPQTRRSYTKFKQGAFSSGSRHGSKRYIMDRRKEEKRRSLRREVPVLTNKKNSKQYHSVRSVKEMDDLMAHGLRSYKSASCLSDLNQFKATNFKETFAKRFNRNSSSHHILPVQYDYEGIGNKTTYIHFTDKQSEKNISTDEITCL
ncbi:formin-like protein 3 isoform X1 [Argonauta hians]